MVTVRKHPSAYNDENNAWTDDENALGPEDNACAYTNRAGSPTSNRLLLSSYGFEIPSNATITRVVIAVKSMSANGYGFQYAAPIDFCLRLPDGSLIVRAGGVKDYPVSCADATIYFWTDITNTLEALGYLYPDFFNNEEFTSFIYQAYVIAIGNYGYCDAVYIEVEYTVPVVKKALRNIQMDEEWG